MTIHKTALRLPKDLHELILDAANNSGISMNAEIVTRLRKSFDNLQTNESLIRQIANEEARELIKKELNKK